jgi:hypothetical protein
MFLNVNFAYIAAQLFSHKNGPAKIKVGQLECLLGTQSSIRSLNFLYIC